MEGAQIKQLAVLAQRLQAERGAELAKLRRGVGGHGQPAVGAAVGVGRGAAGVAAVARALRLDAFGQVAAGVGVHQHHRGLQHRGVDVLALARPRAPVQRGADRQRAQHPDRHVDDRKADLDRRRVGAGAGHQHHAGERLHHVVVGAAAGPRTLLAVARDRAVDDAGPHGADGLVVQPAAGHHAGAEVLDEHVGRGRQPAHQLGALRLANVDGQRTLAGVQGREARRRVAIAGTHARRAHHVAALRRFDLDYLGAQLRQVERGQRPGDDVRQVEHAHAFQGFAHVRLLSSGSGRSGARSRSTWRFRRG